MSSSETQSIFYICDGQGFEGPSGFDARRAMKMVNGLKRSLDALFPEQVQGPFQDQDCTHFVRLRLPYKINANGNQCDLYISNFGDMAALEHEECVPAEDLTTIRKAAEQHGFQWIHEADLLREYDGQGPGNFSTWWNRFFDYV